jgi:hypothetical protein
MSRPNGRRTRAIQGLAAALQECFDASIESAEKRLEPRFEAIDSRFEKVETRLDKQDATLRMIWTQCGGKPDQRLPVDD